MNSRTVCIALLAMAGVLLPAIGAEAFGTCKKASLSAEGPVRKGERSAMRAAIAAWEQKARKTHGRQFSDYWYSGDRTISCTWDASGVNYRCRATALPCG
jgi:hypothetical protein